MTLEQWAAVVQTGGVVVLLVASLFGLSRQWWVPGWVHRAMQQERDFWRETALTAMGNTTDVLQAAKQHTTLTPEQADVALRIIAEAGRQGAGK